MNLGRTVFSQLVDLLPTYQFQICVDRYQGNRYVKDFSCWDQFLSLAFAQLTYRESLRDIEACLVKLGRNYRRHGPGLAVHVQRNLQSEQIEQCWSHIRDGVSVARNLPVGKEHAGNEAGIYAVISAPGFG